MIRRALWVTIQFVVACGALGAGARPPAIQISQPSTYTAEELSIAINPVEPSRLAAGANIRFLFRSSTGGAHWLEDSLYSSYGVAGDPCVIYDAFGNLYYAHLSYPLSGGSWLDRIVVQKSTDDGATWTDGVGVGLNGQKDQDKEWLAADRSQSIHRGNLYLAWTEFDTYGSAAAADSTRILFARSTDLGAGFETPIRLSDRGGDCLDDDATVEGAVPAVGPEGQVYVAWAGHQQILFDRSFDGGATFGEDLFVCDQPGGWAFDVPGIYRCNGLPVTACDGSDSPFRGRVYVLFSDQRNGSWDTDVFLCHSDNEGLSWSAPSRVNTDDTATQQFFPALAVDPTSGYLYVVYYDRRATNGSETDVYVAVSTNGGETFRDQPVSDTAFLPDAGVFFGDYIGIDAHDGVAYAVWMRMDAGNLAVRGVRLDPASAAREGGGFQVSSLMEAPANPVGRQTRIRFTLFDTAPVRLELFDVRGRLVRSLVTETRGAGSYTEAWDGTDRGGSPVPSGVYLCRLEAGSDVVTRKISIVR